MTDYEKQYNDFWKDIVEKDGVVDMEQVKKELFDFRFMMKEVPKVYMEVTGGKISKTNTYAFEVINIFNDEYLDKAITQEDINELLVDDVLTPEEKLEEIKAYLEL